MADINISFNYNSQKVNNNKNTKRLPKLKFISLLEFSLQEKEKNIKFVPSFIWNYLHINIERNILKSFDYLLVASP